MNVLSLFDGISCGQIALNRANIKYDNYFASEIKKIAIKVTQYNYPQTIQLGDIRNIRFSNGTLYTKGKNYTIGKIDLIIGGSPCQDFSNLKGYYTKKTNSYGLGGEKSKLFFEYLRLLRECNPTYFLLENVKMKEDSKKLLNDYLGVQGIEINSNLVSAQNRKRLYWTNIPNITIPRDKNIILPKILEKNYENLKKCKVNKTPSRDIMWYGSKCKNITNELKSSCLTTKMDRWNNAGLISFEDYCRFLTPLECERLQTLPKDYTKILSRNQRYNVIGDGWTIDIITHILKCIKTSF